MTSQKQLSPPILQIQQLIRNAIICLGGFLIVAITAMPSFNAFTTHNTSSHMTQGMITYVPLFIGVSFLIALLACSLALLVLLVCQQLKSDLKAHQNTLEVSPSSKVCKNIKRLSYLSCISLFLLGTAIFFNLLTYFAILSA